MTGERDRSRLAERIEEVAHILYDLPKDERSRAGALEMAEMLTEISSVRFEKGEEPIAPRIRPEGRRES